MKEITARLYAKGKSTLERKQFVMHERKGIKDRAMS